MKIVRSKEWWMRQAQREADHDVEATARSLCRKAGLDPDSTLDGYPAWEDHVPEARRILGFVEAAAGPISNEAAL